MTRYHVFIPKPEKDTLSTLAERGRGTNMKKFLDKCFIVCGHPGQAGRICCVLRILNLESCSWHCVADQDLHGNTCAINSALDRNVNTNSTRQEFDKTSQMVSGRIHNCSPKTSASSTVHFSKQICCAVNLSASSTVYLKAGNCDVCCESFRVTTSCPVCLAP